MAAALDFCLGDPKFLPHPVCFLGILISFWQKLYYPLKNKLLAGALLLFSCLLSVGVLLILLFALLNPFPYLLEIVEIYLLYAALAWKSLKKESSYVAEAVMQEDLPLARKMLSYIVGRDTAALSFKQCLSGTIETVAENTIDGIIAPLFYMLIGYFLGIHAILVWLFNTVSTLDSMVGYKNDKYRQFGTFSARCDDLLNFIPARIGSFFLLLGGGLAGFSLKKGWQIFLRDRLNHKSPNSAHPESAMAGLLGIRLGGPSFYGGNLLDKPYMGDDCREIDVDSYVNCCKIVDYGVILFLLAIFLLIWRW
ncbi:MAG: adenosylcobinamide-phosphate synthase CbiB [Clostridiales bacterium]